MLLNAYNYVNVFMHKKDSKSQKILSLGFKETSLLKFGVNQDRWIMHIIKWRTHCGFTMSVRPSVGTITRERSGNFKLCFQQSITYHTSTLTCDHSTRISYLCIYLILFWN